MSRGFLLFQFKMGGVFGIFLLFLFGAGISGCGPATTQGETSKPKPCKPLEPNANIYNVASLTFATNNSVPTDTVSNGTSGSVAGLTIEQALSLLQGAPSQNLPVVNPSDPNNAYKMLVIETENWSDTQTVLLNESSKAQIVVTFLSPPLIQAIYYVEALTHGPAVVSLQTELAEIAKREELIFFVTIITSVNGTASLNSVDMELPVHSMIIMNTDDLAVPPLHDDHNLGQPIHSSLEPVFGYISYPIGVKNGESCAWVLNPDYNKKIIITTPSLYVNKQDKGIYTWVIPYAPFLSVSEYSLPPTDIGISFELVRDSKTPPPLMKDLLTPEGIEANTFWQTYAGFLWKQVVMGNY